MIRTLSYSRGKGDVSDPPVDALPALLADPDMWVWVDLDDFTPEELDQVADLMELHPLAVEDCRTAHERPMFQSYDDQAFIAAAVAEYWAPERGLALSELEFFIGQGFIVSVHEEERPVIEQLWRRVQRDPALLEEGPAGVLHRLLTSLVSRFFPIVDDLSNYLEEVEDRVFEEEDEALEAVTEARKDIQSLRQVHGAQCNMLRQLCGYPLQFIPAEALVYLRDIYGDSLRLEDGIGSLREHCNALRELHNSVASARLGRKVQALTVLATLMVPLTLVSGVYGMNFEHIPFGHHPWGFWITTAGMGGLGVVLWAVFRGLRLV